MKKLLLLFFPVLFFSQEKIVLKKLDSLQFNNTLQKVLSDTGKKFVFVKEVKDLDKAYYKYANSENSDEAIKIYYYKNEGFWYFQSIAGNFSNVFSFWRRYADPNSDPEALKEKGTKFLKKEPGYSIFKADNDLWVIRF